MADLEYIVKAHPGETAEVGILYTSRTNKPTELNVCLSAANGHPAPLYTVNIEPQYMEPPTVRHVSGVDIQLPPRIIAEPGERVEVSVFFTTGPDVPAGSYLYSVAFPNGEVPTPLTHIYLNIKEHPPLQGSNRYDDFIGVLRH